MCGIAGILEYQPDVPDLDALLTRMRSSLRHRGPDDEGTLVSAGKEARCGFVHTRLSILDLIPAGHQPMGIPEWHGVKSILGSSAAAPFSAPGAADGGNRYWITFNGEIYNFRELRCELEDQGVLFRSQTDTEIILRLYERDGPRCVEKMVGMFVFAIWDKQEETCFIARDPLGIKMAYYFQAG